MSYTPTFLKDVDETKTYELDWVNRLGSNTISNATTVEDEGDGMLTINSTTVSGTKTLVQFADGTAGQLYCVKTSATLSNTDVRVFRYKIRITDCEAI